MTSDGAGLNLQQEAEFALKAAGADVDDAKR